MNFDPLNASFLEHHDRTGHGLDSYTPQMTKERIEAANKRMQARLERHGTDLQYFADRENPLMNQMPLPVSEPPNFNPRQPALPPGLRPEGLVAKMRRPARDFARWSPKIFSLA